MASIYIVEGVAGSGKDTLTARLLEWLQPESRPVHVFAEEAVLASWLHYFVPGIHESRLDLTHKLVDYAAASLVREPGVIFVFNRFHVSHAVWRAELQAAQELEARHAALVAKLAALPAIVLQAVLEPSDAGARTSHLERRELSWQRFLARRIETHGDASAGASYLKQQEAMSRIIERDGLPYRRLSVRPDKALDISKLLDA